MSANIYREQLVVPGDRVISALDNMSWEAATAQVNEIGDFIGMGKTNALHQRLGTDHAVDTLAENGLYTMLDGKYHDIPETVAGLVREATLSGSSLITVHASGGERMLEAAIKGRDQGRDQTRNVFKRADRERIGGVLGITVLTSLDGEDCESIFGIDKEDKDAIKKKVVQFAYMALDAGLDGIVCSSLELSAIRANKDFDDLLTVVPGITPAFATKATDQKRTTTAKQAIEQGADLVVIGRAINDAKAYGLTKAEAAQAVAEEVKEGLALAA
ncbi:MAG: orotidine 5-phosphate decarboxylase [Candidatus Saccharibacteria bacterium]|nr:orotidine 5-phosphate decarboxylase [Candidatus Saccharibacteria bacterium]